MTRGFSDTAKCFTLLPFELIIGERGGDRSGWGELRRMLCEIGRGTQGSVGEGYFFDCERWGSEEMGQERESALEEGCELILTSLRSG